MADDLTIVHRQASRLRACTVVVTEIVFSRHDWWTSQV
jgi:hypothetical protein